MMKTNQLRLSEQLENYLEEFRDKARAENFPPEILSAIQRLSEMPKYIEIDVEDILQKAKEERQKNKSLLERLAPIDTIDSALKESKKPIIDTLSKYGADRFITAKGNEIESLLYYIFEEIQQVFEENKEIIKRSKDKSDSWYEKTENVKRQLKELENKYNSLKQEYDIQVSYMCKDYQLILEHIGSHPSGKTEQDIKRIIEKALEDINVDVLWEPLEGNNGKYFLTQNDSEATTSGVARPCLKREFEVIHQGVILNPINEKE